MANFDLHIQEAAFQRRGVQPVVDENLLGDFIDTRAPGAPKIDIKLAPHVLWSNGTFTQRAHELINGETMIPVGGYSDQDKTITLPASPDEARTNKLLRHEAGHFFDAVTGASADSPAITKRRLTGALALASAGAGIGLAKRDKKLVVGSALSVIPATQLTYWYAPHEIAAGRFANRQDLIERYGKIITYKGL